MDGHAYCSNVILRTKLHSQKTALFQSWAKDPNNGNLTPNITIHIQLYNCFCLGPAPKKSAHRENNIN